MSLPHVLLVDDSEAILAFESAALASHYVLSTATDGRDALEKLAHGAFDLVVLDLSMPGMDGDEVLTRMRAQPSLSHVPVLVVSSETQRAAACLAAGAQSFLPKPVRADELRARVALLLDDDRARRRRRALAVLPVRVADVEVALPLDAVESVSLLCRTYPLPGGPAYVSAFVELPSGPTCVLDLAERLGVPHSVPLTELKLVVVHRDGLRIALCVDEVFDPEEVAPADVVQSDALGAGDFGPLRELLVAVAKTARGARPVMEARALLSRDLVTQLPALINDVRTRA